MIRNCLMWIVYLLAIVWFGAIVAGAVGFILSVGVRSFRAGLELVK